MYLSSILFLFTSPMDSSRRVFCTVNATARAKKFCHSCREREGGKGGTGEEREWDMEREHSKYAIDGTYRGIEEGWIRGLAGSKEILH